MIAIETHGKTLKTGLLDSASAWLGDRPGSNAAGAFETHQVSSRPSTFQIEAISTTSRINQRSSMHAKSSSCRL